MDLVKKGIGMEGGELRVIVPFIVFSRTMNVFQKYQVDL